MERELEATQLKYQEILSKQTEAQVAQNLETERKGEKFTLIEPPQPPEKPVSPNRLLIVLGGTVLAVALGFGAVVAREVLDASVRGPGDIRQLLQVPALVSIPLIVTASDRARHKRFLFYSWSGTVAALLLIVVGVHFFVRPLDVVWLGLWRRFGV
jgi:succinoglycan biosynthesis transport protein ExoP